jgi:hypothetical protein
MFYFFTLLYIDTNYLVAFLQLVTAMLRLSVYVFVLMGEPSRVIGLPLL